MKFGILLLLSLSVFSTCLFDQVKELVEKIKKGNEYVSNFIELTEGGINLINNIQEKNYEKLISYFSNEDNLFFRSLQKNKHFNWDRILKCVKSFIGMIPCSKAVILAIGTKRFPEIIASITLCPLGIRNTIKHCFE